MIQVMITNGRLRKGKDFFWKNPVTHTVMTNNRTENKITNKVRAELILRVSKGYENINLGLVEEFIYKALKEMNVI